MQCWFQKSGKASKDGDSISDSLLLCTLFSCLCLPATQARASCALHLNQALWNSSYFIKGENITRGICKWHETGKPRAYRLLQYLHIAMRCCHHKPTLSSQVIINKCLKCYRLVESFFISVWCGELKDLEEDSDSSWRSDAQWDMFSYPLYLNESVRSNFKSYLSLSLFSVLCFYRNRLFSGCLKCCFQKKTFVLRILGTVLLWPIRAL